MCLNANSLVQANDQQPNDMFEWKSNVSKWEMDAFEQIVNNGGVKGTSEEGGWGWYTSKRRVDKGGCIEVSVSRAEKSECQLGL